MSDSRARARVWWADKRKRFLPYEGCGNPQYVNVEAVLEAFTDECLEPQEAALRKIINESTGSDGIRVVCIMRGIAEDALAHLEHFPEPESDAPGDGYVAWLRFAGEGSRQGLQICDSDSPGAFKVYRRKGPLGTCTLSNNPHVKDSHFAPCVGWRPLPAADEKKED